MLLRLTGIALKLDPKFCRLCKILVETKVIISQLSLRFSREIMALVEIPSFDDLEILHPTSLYLVDKEAILSMASSLENRG